MRGRLDSATAGEDSAATDESVLGALDDERSRRILGMLRVRPRSAPEIADELDMPTSTVYRKLDALVETALVEQSHRLGTDGHHSTQYHCDVDRVVVEFEADGTVSLSVARDAPAEE